MTAAKVTQQSVEVLYSSSAVPNVRVTQQVLDVLHGSTAVPNVRVTLQAVEVLYEQVIPTTAGVTQEYAETLSKPTSVSASVTQEYAEILSVPQNPKIAVSQEYVESISERINSVFSSAVYCETIANVWVSLFPCRVTEIYIEAISATSINTRIHDTSIIAEVLHKTDVTERVTEMFLEVHNKPTTVAASVSSNFVEIIRKTQGTSTSININAPL